MVQHGKIVGKNYIWQLYLKIITGYFHTVYVILMFSYMKLIYLFLRPKYAE